MSKYLLLFLILIESIVGYSNNYSKEKDSLRKLILENTGDAKAQYLINLAYYYVYSNKDSALYFFDNASFQAQTEKQKAICYFEIAKFHQYFKNNDQCLQSLDSALNYNKGKDDSLTVSILYEKNILLTNKGFYQQALEVALETLEKRKKIGDKNEELNAILQVGYTYDRMEDYHSAIKWYQKGLQLKGVNNENYIGRNYGLLGIAFDELKDYEKAIHYNLIAINHFKKVPNSVYLSTWYSNLGNTYTKIGKLDLAEDYTLAAIKLNSQNNFSAYINLAKIYIDKGKLDNAEKILIEKTKELETADQQRFLAEAYYRLYELYDKKGNYQKALNYYIKFKKTEDVRLAEDKLIKIQEFTIQYESQEKEKMILSQQNKIKENQLKLKNRNLWIMGLASTTSIIGLLGWSFYRKQVTKSTHQKNENLLKLTQQEMANEKKLTDQRTHIARDLHDNIGAHLTFIISSLENLNHSTKINEYPIFQNKIKQINSFTKTTIQELRDSIWAINQDEITLEDLIIRITNFIESANINKPKFNINVLQLVKEPQEIHLTSNAGINIYRILQEGINNAIKHSNAKNINITFEKDDNNLNLTIKDDGNGFDLEKLNEDSNGLQNIKKRTKLLKGTLDITTNHTGTAISCTFQYSQLKKQTYD
ncbi:MAG TPA: histidine kinase [Edaphocola sp.]|nr:histidine kinase [Edaphocola sp.]